MVETETCTGDCVSVVQEWDEEAKMLAESAREASREAVARAFAAGLPITVAKDGKLMSIAPDGTETIIRALRDCDWCV